MREVDEANTEARRSRIVEAAARCLARDGVAKTSISDICREAGMRPGHLYYYFPSKDEVLLAVMLRNREAVIEAVEHMLDGDDIPAQIFDVHQTAEDDRLTLGLTPAARVELESYFSRRPESAAIAPDDDGDFLFDVMRRATVAAIATGRLPATTDVETFVNAVALIWQGLSYSRLSSAFDFGQMRKAVELLLGPCAPRTTSSR
jgi:AcrR family transcriptional regulator